MSAHDPITDTEGAALILGVTPERVRQLDHVLHPWRVGRDGRRIFLVTAVEHYAAARDVRRSK